MQIAIDGPAASGKTTVARLVARRLGAQFVDTGAMYRALAYLALQRGVAAGDEPELVRLAADAVAQTTGFGEQALQAPDVTAIVSTVAAHPGVRAAMVEAQRAVATGKPVVMAGRDIGTVVLPNAPVKVYLTASVAARVERRRAQLERAGVNVDARKLREEILARDRLDSTRAVSPLEPAADAHRLDSSDLPAERVADEICAIVRRASRPRG